MSDPPPPYPGNPAYSGKSGGVPYHPVYPPTQASYPGTAGYPPPPLGPYAGQPYPGTGPAQPMYGQPAGYPQQPAYGHTSTVVVTQPVSVLTQYRDAPASTTCPSCHAQIVTSTYYESGTFTWLMCALLCIVGCDAGCCLIPFCVDSCKDVVHSCPNCNNTLSRYSRL